jgi:hypothetical protein
MSDHNNTDEPTSAPAQRSLEHTTKLSDLTVGDLTAILRGEIAAQLRTRGAGAASHVNSGPPGFVNGGGHANFDPGSHVNSGPPGFVNGGGHANFDPDLGFASRFGQAASHVNSGPPGFVNGGGHANFDPASTLTGQNVLTRVTPPGGGQVVLPATGPVNMRVRGVLITR